MDAMAAGVPVTEREGYQVELNSLWYNAICFALSMAISSSEKSFREEWEPVKRT
jgi:glycogen debranching enzyme